MKFFTFVVFRHMFKGYCNDSHDTWTNLQCKYVNFCTALLMSAVQHNAQTSIEAISPSEFQIYIHRGTVAVLSTAVRMYKQTCKLSVSFDAHILAVFASNGILTQNANTVLELISRVGSPPTNQAIRTIANKIHGVFAFDDYTTESVHARYMRYHDSNEITIDEIYKLYRDGGLMHCTKNTSLVGMTPNLQYFVRVVCGVGLKHAYTNTHTLIRLGCSITNMAVDYNNHIQQDHKKVFVRHSNVFDTEIEKFTSLCCSEYNCYIDPYVDISHVEESRRLVGLVAEYDAWVGYGWVRRKPYASMMDAIFDIFNLVTHCDTQNRLEYYRRDIQFFGPDNIISYNGEQFIQQTVADMLDDIQWDGQKTPMLSHPRLYNQIYSKIVRLFDAVVASREIPIAIDKYKKQFV